MQDTGSEVADCNVMRASIYRTAGMGYYSQRNGQLGATMQLAGSLLALLCLFFGMAFSAYVPSSLEQRIGSLFLFGLIPAVGFYAAGHILARLLMFGASLCELIAARCLRCFVISVGRLACWVRQLASGLSIRCLVPVARCRLTKLSDVQKTYEGFINILPLLIRNGARFSASTRWVSDLPRGGLLFRSSIVKSMFLMAFGLGWCAGNAIWPLELKRNDPIGAVAIDAIVERILRVESSGDPNARNKRSSATGLAQF